MHVLNTHTCQFEEIDPENPEGKVYAILSHTWAKKPKPEEQTYEQLRNIQRRYGISEDGASSSPGLLEHSIPWLACKVLLLLHAIICVFIGNLSKLLQPQSIWEDRGLSPKIRDACRVARENSYNYIWIDSCCIDKSSSSELSEAINSMYKWYNLAAVCYAYLADVSIGENHQVADSHFRRSEWFRRGWTLQELLAPASVEFLSKEWLPIGSKHALIDLVESITKIDREALLHWAPLDAFSVAQRLSWASNRKTTRVEDRAYSLLGMFNINMPTLYGEGDRAFRRLQELIMERIPDQSLFAWGRLHRPSQLSHTMTQKAHLALLQTVGRPRYLFAISPDYFKGCEDIRTAHRGTGQLLSAYGHKIAYTPTPYGISTQLWMVPLTRALLLRAIPHSADDLQLDTSDLPEGSQCYLVILRCELGKRQGHLLGRICYVTPSDESDVNFVYTGYINLKSQQYVTLGAPELFTLSPETIEHWLCDPQIELQTKTVYIPHPDRTTLPQEVHSHLREQSYTVIQLVLLRATCDTLRSRGYSAKLRKPDPVHSIGTHWLTLSKGDHTITVKFKHNLQDNGKEFTITAKVEVSGSRVQPNSAPHSSQGRPDEIFWRDRRRWETKLLHKSVELSVAGARTLTLDIELDFGGQGYCASMFSATHRLHPHTSSLL